MNPLNRDEVWQLLCEYTQSDLLRKHCLAVEAAMKWYARKFGEDENLWGNIGLVHDFAYEKFPDQHPQKDGEILKELGWSPRLVSITAGGTPATHLYVKNQQRACAQVEIAYEDRPYPAEITELELLAAIQALNVDPRVTGIIDLSHSR